MTTLPRLFKLLALLVAGLLVLTLLDPGGLEDFVAQANVFVYQHFGNLYLWFAMLVLVALAGLACSPLGKIKLGAPDEKPAFSFFSWFAMLFCAGMGTGFMFWGGGEPLYHYLNPPLANALVPATRQTQAFAYTFFHWGLTPWAIYAMTALAVGYFCFNQKRPLRFSAFLMSRSQAGQFASDGVDLFALLAFVFGISATFGMGVLMIEGGLHTLLGWPMGAGLKLSVLGAMTLLFLLSAYFGLSKGIKWLSNTSVILTLLLMLAVFILGPATDIVGSAFSGTMHYLAGLPAMSLGAGQFIQPDWVREWTVKYWSWWIAWAPFVGVFIALISKGRSIRQIVFGVVVVPALFSILWFSVMGQAAIDLYRLGAFGSQPLDLAHIQVVWYRLMETYGLELGWASALSLFSVIMVGVFVCDSADSAAYTIACLSQPDIAGRLLADTNSTHAYPEPAFGVTLAWGLLFSALTAILLLCGGLGVLQQVTAIMVLPFTLMLIGIFVALIRALVVDAFVTTPPEFTVSIVPVFPPQKSPETSPEKA